MRDNLYVLEAGNIFANVNANTTSGSWVGTFHATGTFSGSLNARELGGFVAQGIQQRFWIEGDLAANVSISEQVRNYNIAAPEIEVGGKLSASRVFKTGRNLPSGTVFSMTPVDGLAGCVILNASNSTFGWSGDVKVDGITLSPTSYGAPYYTIASSALGGGAVGLVPYHLYVNDCSPVSTGSPGPSLFDSVLNHRFNDPDRDKSIYLRFYGPVFAVPDTTRPVRIEYNTGSNWIDISHHFYINVESTAASTSREVEIHGGNGESAFMPGEYRISPVAGRLKCAQTTAASAPDVGDFMYYF